MKNYIPLILGMTAVTYLPRLLPLITLSKRNLHPLLRQFLLYVPYTALGVLIVRGVSQSKPDMMFAAIAGMGASVICSWLNGGMILSVFASIITSFLFLNFFVLNF